MAIPPDPVEDVVRDVTSVAVCEVTSADPPPPAHDDGVDDADEDDDNESQLPAQHVVLRVQSVIHGTLAVGQKLEALKPIGEYALREGYVGPFLLDERTRPAIILGRYGPDSYGVDEIRRALRAKMR